MSIYDYGDPFIEWNEANDANDDGQAIIAAERQAGESGDDTPGYPHTSQTLAALGLAPEQLSPDDRAAYERVKAHDDRIAAILEANGGEVICPRCNRPTMGWPFKRPDKCGGKDAVYCIRDPEAALADIARRAGREAD